MRPNSRWDDAPATRRACPSCGHQSAWVLADIRSKWRGGGQRYNPWLPRPKEPSRLTATACQAECSGKTRQQRGACLLPSPHSSRRGEARHAGTSPVLRIAPFGVRCRHIPCCRQSRSILPRVRSSMRSNASRPLNSPASAVHFAVGDDWSRARRICPSLTSISGSDDAAWHHHARA